MQVKQAAAVHLKGEPVIFRPRAKIHVIAMLVHVERQEKSRLWVWSSAQVLTSTPSRAAQHSSTHPEPPASALARAANSTAQRSNPQKSFSI